MHANDNRITVIIVLAISMGEGCSCVIRASDIYTLSGPQELAGRK